MPRSHNHDRTYITPADSQKLIDASIIADKGNDPSDAVVHGQLGTAAYLDQTWLYASATWDAGSVATAA